MNNHNFLAIYYQNVNGLRTKIKEFYKNIALEDHDILLLTESNLTDDFYDNELIDSRYILFKNNRNCAYVGKKSGGGVIIAIKSFIEAISISVPCQDPRFEHVWIKINSSGKSLVVGVVYIPPSSEESVYDSFLDVIDYICTNFHGSEILVCGDFNLPNVKWDNEDDSISYLPSSSVSKYVEFLHSVFFFGFHQFNHYRNSCDNVLDLCFYTDVSINVELSDSPISKVDEFHPPLSIVLSDIKSDEIIDNSYWKYDFKKANYTLINEYLNNVEWNHLNDSLQLDEFVDQFYLIVYYVIDLFVPKKSCKYHYKFPVWFSKELKSCILAKKEAHKKYKGTGLIADYYKFSDLREKCNILEKQCHSNFICKIESNINFNSKSFWSYVNGKKKSNKLPSTMKYRNQSFTDPKQIANSFADYFGSVYSDPDLQNKKHLPPRSHLSFDKIYLSTDLIFQELLSLDINKGAGPDGVPPIFLFNCSFSIVFPLYYMFDKSLKSGHFPDRWKLSFIVPIFKSGSKNTIENFRPISILSAIPKLFEKIVNDQITFHCKNIINTHQHGFMKGKSTSTNLIPFISDVANCLERGCEVHCIYTDFSKAFDKVSHWILVAKLEAYGFHGPLLSWLESYLSNRSQVVKVGRDVFSEPIEVSSGVPQGSHLGPVLFNIFINDIAEVFEHCKFSLFADDLKLYKAVDSINDIICIQNDIDRFFSWCENNGVVLNIDKCKCLQFSHKVDPWNAQYELNGQDLNNVTEHTDLGVLLNTSLTFDKHIDKISARARRSTGFIIRHSSDFHNPFTIIRLYQSLVRSILEYCCVIWDPYFVGEIEVLEKVQEKFMRYIWFKSKCTEKFSYQDALCRFNLASLETRRKQQILMLSHKILIGSYDAPEILSQFFFKTSVGALRKPEILKATFHRTSYAQNNPIDKMCNVLNSVYHDINLFSANETIVKKQIRAFSF